MKHYSLVIDPQLVKEIDRLIREHGLFSSRSDFMRDAIRQRLIEIKQAILEDQKEGGHGKETQGGKKKADDDETRGIREEYRYRGVY